MFSFSNKNFINQYSRQLCCANSFIRCYNGLLKHDYNTSWQQYNYVIYLVEAHPQHDRNSQCHSLAAGNCFFVQKGMNLAENLSNTAGVYIIFFLPDEFIYETLKNKTFGNDHDVFNAVININSNKILHNFFASALLYLNNTNNPCENLLVLKCKELVWILADDRYNNELHGYFFFLLQQPQAVSLQQTMEANFCDNLKLEEFAQRSMRSLSSFKRDFKRLYNTSPGRWLLEKRLDYAYQLITKYGRNVSEAAFETGFENSSHFSRAFRQKFGYTALAIRKQLPSKLSCNL